MREGRRERIKLTKKHRNKIGYAKSAKITGFFLYVLQVYKRNPYGLVPALIEIKKKKKTPTLG